MWWSSWSLWSDSKFWVGLLKYPSPIFAWRRTAFDLFSFFSWRKRHKTKVVSQPFEENQRVHPVLDRQGVFLQWRPWWEKANGHGPSHKSLVKTQEAFVFSSKIPNQCEAERKHSLIGNVEGKSFQKWKYSGIGSGFEAIPLWIGRVSQI